MLHLVERLHYAYMAPIRTLSTGLRYVNPLQGCTYHERKAVQENEFHRTELLTKAHYL